MNLDQFSGLARALFEEDVRAQFLVDSLGESILDANGAAQRLTGYSIRELMKMTIKKLFRFDDRSLWRVSQWVATPTCQPVRFRWRLRAAAGELRPTVHVSLVRLSVQPDPVVLMTVRPVQRKNMFALYSSQPSSSNFQQAPKSTVSP